MKALTIALAGNPNSGKTTIFNALTGSNQRIGNWPGVTVEKKVGSYMGSGINVCVMDIPGVYSLNVANERTAIDERIACEYLLSDHANVVVNVVDASNLERNLYLTIQLLEMRIPVIVALNMIDVAKRKNYAVDTAQLAKYLGCPVVPLQANKNIGIEALKQAILVCAARGSCAPLQLSYPHAVQNSIEKISEKLSVNEKYFSAIKFLEDEAFLTNLKELPALQQEKQLLQQKLTQDIDIVIASTRYEFANKIARASLISLAQKNYNFTKHLDRFALNRWLGIPIFLALMYLMFLFAINIGGAFQDFFDISSQTIFVQGFSEVLNFLHAPAWFTAVIAVGVGKGINTTITFTPIIAAMFFFLAFLEDSGYMARAAFVMDRLMRAMGLPGKAFVPLIVGFGCNVPAIMSARTLENQRDRILTVMMSPFMSCGARLAIFAIFTAAFFPAAGQDVVFALYVIGILVAILSGMVLRKTALKGEPAPLVMELPPYHIPHFKNLCFHAWNRLKNFLWRAGKLIVPICILIGALNAITIHGGLSLGEANQDSLLSAIGRMLTPIFAPIGIKHDNWPATVGLFTGVLAKEVVIATLNTLYTQVGHLANITEHFNFTANLYAAILSIPENLRSLMSALSNPILANAKVQSVNTGVYGVMYRYFDGRIGAFAYLLFVLLYVPCVSTIAAVARELGRGWAAFSVFWNTSLAYGIAVIFYQLATLPRHPQSSIFWLVGILIFFAIVVMLLRKFALVEKTSLTAKTVYAR